eukprot:scaffold1701_cov35-Tisochrysis_lutea.AAC.2
MSQHSTPKFDPMPPDDPNDITRSRAELQTANGAPSQPAAIEPQRMFDERSDDDEQEDDGPNTMDDGDQNCAVIELTVNGEPRQRKRARTRQNFSWRQVSVLEQVFEIGPLPSPVSAWQSPGSRPTHKSHKPLTTRLPGWQFISGSALRACNQAQPEPTLCASMVSKPAAEVEGPLSRLRPNGTASEECAAPERSRCRRPHPESFCPCRQLPFASAIAG